MRFKEWFLLNEDPYVTLGKVVETPEGILWQLDLKIETWKIAEGDQRTKEMKNHLRQIHKHVPFYGFIPTVGKYLYYDGNAQRDFEVIREKPGMGIDLDELHIPVPHSWWKYVFGVDPNGKMVKKPEPVPKPEPVFAIEPAA